MRREPPPQPQHDRGTHDPLRVRNRAPSAAAAAKVDDGGGGDARERGGGRGEEDDQARHLTREEVGRRAEQQQEEPRVGRPTAAQLECRGAEGRGDQRGREELVVGIGVGGAVLGHTVHQRVARVSVR